MEVKTIIFNSELEFREYVVQHSKDIRQIVVFEDILEQTIFFYCFMQKNVIIAAKESTCKEFFFYKEIYVQLSNSLHLNVKDKHHQIRII